MYILRKRRKALYELYMYQIMLAYSCVHFASVNSFLMCKIPDLELQRRPALESRGSSVCLQGNHENSRIFCSGRNNWFRSDGRQGSIAHANCTKLVYCIEGVAQVQPAISRRSTCGRHFMHTFVTQRSETRLHNIFQLSTCISSTFPFLLVNQ